MHIGLLNMMPDAALEATERQFLRLLGACNQIVQFHVHIFTIDGLTRSPKTQAHIDKYYESFAQIKKDGLDALIISGANVVGSDLTKEDFWQPLTEVFSWAHEHVTSVLCSCLATHALIQFSYGIKRTPIGKNVGGSILRKPLTERTPWSPKFNTRFDVPHSRFNEIFQRDIEQKGLTVLVASNEGGVHLAVSPDGFRTVFFQGHPEYDDISLLKEYKREVMRFYQDERPDFPPFPENYFNTTVQDVLQDYQLKVMSAKQHKQPLLAFPEHLILDELDNTWRDTAKAVFNNWLGKIYQLTNQDRKLPFMPGIDPNNPLSL